MSLLLAIETVQELENHILELNTLLTEAQAASDAQQLSSGDQFADKSLISDTCLPETAWIHNTWLCLPANRDFLGHIESHWRRGQVSFSLNILETLIKKQDINLPERSKLRLLKSAIIFNIYDWQKLMENANAVVELCQASRSSDFSTFCELIGIAHFIRGKSLLAMEEWECASWAFSRATSVPGYRRKAMLLKETAWVKLNGSINDTKIKGGPYSRPSASSESSDWTSVPLAPPEWPRDSVWPFGLGEDL
ncbi:hypothetical protein AJ79_00536 [Helicocarpus griseus UAMH5409]|uniref:Uncharacterized protein n=1 Tax=Helicocarpus griseus UAMH5409 TaxID=1447875 RepID=A0A2B7YAB3_9EURO|nr:hypothetical protein AJ79_00536 [Helicocarpus griseus UAMH5409]